MTKVIILLAAVFFFAHAFFVYGTSPHCSNLYNRSCYSAVYEVWKW